MFAGYTATPLDERPLVTVHPSPTLGTTPPPPSRDTDTEATLARHLDAIIRRDVEAVLANFTEDSVIITADGVIRGLSAIRADAEAFFSETPEGLIEAIEVVRREVVGEIAYIIWKAEPYVPMASETFLIRGGKVLVQTYVSQDG